MTTQPTAPALVGGLVVGAEYEVDIVNGKVELRYTDALNLGQPVLFTTAGVGVHGFSHVTNTDSFAPKTAVDDEED